MAHVTRASSEGVFRGSPLGGQIRSTLEFIRHAREVKVRVDALRREEALGVALRETGGDMDRAKTIVRVDAEIDNANQVAIRRVKAANVRRSEAQLKYFEELRATGIKSGRAGGLKRADIARRKAEAEGKKRTRKPLATAERQYKNWHARMRRARMNGWEDPPLPTDWAEAAKKEADDE